MVDPPFLLPSLVGRTCLLRLLCSLSTSYGEVRTNMFFYCLVLFTSYPHSLWVWSSTFLSVIDLNMRWSWDTNILSHYELLTPPIIHSLYVNSHSVLTCKIWTRLGKPKRGRSTCHSIFFGGELETKKVIEKPHRSIKTIGIIFIKKKIIKRGDGDILGKVILN